MTQSNFVSIFFCGTCTCRVLAINPLHPKRQAALRNVNAMQRVPWNCPNNHHLNWLGHCTNGQAPPPHRYSVHSRWLPPCRMAPTSARSVCWRMPGGWPVSGRRRTVISSRCAWITSTVCWTSTHWCGRRWRPLPQKGMHAGWGILCPCISVSGWWTDEWMDKVHIGCVARRSHRPPSATEQIMHYWAACKDWTTPNCKTQLSHFLSLSRLNKIGKNPNIMSQREETNSMNTESKTISAVVNALAAEADQENNLRWERNGIKEVAVHAPGEC